MDVNGLWVSGDPDANITWSKPNVAVKDGPQLQSWQIQREEELLYTENDDRAEWGRLLFTGPAVYFVVARRLTQYVLILHLGRQTRKRLIAHLTYRLCKNWHFTKQNRYKVPYSYGR